MGDWLFLLCFDDEVCVVVGEFFFVVVFEDVL